MTLNAKPRMDVVKREDKETKLKAFVLNLLSARNEQATAATWCVMARSMESPVILALSALAPQIRAAGITIKLLFTQAALSIVDGVAEPVIGLAREVRYTRDIRLLDAHEQLSIDGTTSWIGDCMRREPAKRDAYECYAIGCADTANWSTKAFDRMWAFGEPLLIAKQVPTLVERATPAADEFPLPVAEVPATVVASTRH